MPEETIVEGKTIPSLTETEARLLEASREARLLIEAIGSLREPLSQIADSLDWLQHGGYSGTSGIEEIRDLATQLAAAIAKADEAAGAE